MTIKNLLVSRTDGIGDVILALPAIGLVKKLNPGIKILFMGRSYTEPIIRACEHIDAFINCDEISSHGMHEQIEYLASLQADAIVHIFPNKLLARLACRSGIPLRIGTSHRFYNWLYCNHLEFVGRKNSSLHESQLNALLFRKFGINNTPTLNELSISTGLTNPPKLDTAFGTLLDPSRFNLILHPKSKGSAREWGMDNYSELIHILPKERYKIFISGTDEERLLFKAYLEKWANNVTDITGQMSLTQLIAFINNSDGLIAASTGPLHIAAGLNKIALGLFAPMRPIHPGRWAPIGPNADYLVVEKKCIECRHSKQCKCIESITPETVFRKLEQMRLHAFET